jgi:hypothetical protein
MLVPPGKAPAVEPPRAAFSHSPRWATDSRPEPRAVRDRIEPGHADDRLPRIAEAGIASERWWRVVGLATKAS